ncbi:MAG: purine-binding chemotaxis protein CheW [Proteobacteria bacterium]|nr:purine-binding chemotaxis protein CheW [Pseudomonadota bacterium]
MTAEAKPVNEKSTNSQELAKGEVMQFLTFSVSGAEYGVDIMAVREIKGWTEATRMPNSPEYMRGVINLRGVVIPIFDLRTRFGMGVTLAESKHVVVVMAVANRTIGVLADAVSDILTVQASEIKSAPVSDTTIDKEFINGLISVQDKMVVLLNVENLFEIDQIPANVEKAS